MLDDEHGILTLRKVSRVNLCDGSWFDADARSGRRLWCVIWGGVRFFRMLKFIYTKTLKAEMEFENPNADIDDLFLEYLAWLGKATSKFGSFTEMGMEPSEASILCTRIANLCVRWLREGSVAPPWNVLVGVSSRKTLIWSIFQASVFNGQRILHERAADYVFADVETDFGGLGGALEITSNQISGSRLPRLAALISINDASRDIIDASLAQAPQLSFMFWLGWCSERIKVTDQALTNEKLLFRYAIERSPIGVSSAQYAAATGSFMHLTYMLEPKKHEMKKFLSRCFHDGLVRAGIQFPSIERNGRKDRPKILIPLERFVSGHAMHRCYAEYIVALRDSFETIALVNAHDIDDAASLLFDRVLIKEPNWSVQDVINICAMEAPDIVYYPSIGMSTWVILLSTVRVAPLQVMTCGHPATSCSSEIDVVYLKDVMHINKADIEKHFCEEVIWGEEVINDGVPWTTQLLSPKITGLKRSITEWTKSPRIAVNCKVMKLNWVFLQALAEIDQRLKSFGLHPTFDFFPAEMGMGVDGLTNFMQRTNLHAVVHSYKAYEDFLQELSNTQISLVPFPFGNTNSTMDALLLGKPIVFLRGTEPCSLGDQKIASHMGLLDIAETLTVEQYINRACELLLDKSKYDGCVNRISNIKIDSLLIHEDDKNTRELKGFVRRIRECYDKFTGTEV